MVNFREKWRGYLWQGRFSSCVLDEKHLLAAVRYVLCNPVRAGLVSRPSDHRWSSAIHHLAKKPSGLLTSNSLLNDLISDWEAFLSSDVSEESMNVLRKHERTGRPLGGNSFVMDLELVLGRNLMKRHPGPKRNSECYDN
jgi:putative transposase